MAIFGDDLIITGTYEVNLDLDHEGAFRLMPRDFFDENEDFIASHDEVYDWLNDGGRAKVQEYFATDVIAITEEINPKYIDVTLE